MCDEVNGDPETKVSACMDSLRSRLSVKDANVLLRTITLILALSENCGSRMKQSIATKAFMGALCDIIKDPRIHPTVKRSLAELLVALTKSFQDDPSLKIVGVTAKEMQFQFPNLFHSPEKPQKQEITSSDRNKEEEELNLALKLSLNDYHSQSPSQQQHEPQPTVQQSPKVTESVDHVEPNTVAKVSRVRALYDLTSLEADELSFRKGDIITVIESVYKDWWRGSLKGKIGIFPLNYVTPLQEPTKQELIQEAELEYEVLRQGINIEKLLSLLSNKANSGDVTEISRVLEDEQVLSLYNSITPLRPKLTKMIEKYSLKKDELLELNEKLASSEKLYNNLMDQSVAKYRATNNRAPYPL